MNKQQADITTKPANIWQRGLYMLLFSFLIGIAKFVAFSVIALQFLFVLFSNTPNQQLLKFGLSLSTYTYQIMLFLTFNSEDLPYPINEWPQ